MPCAQRTNGCAERAVVARALEQLGRADGRQLVEVRETAGSPSPSSKSADANARSSPNAAMAPLWRSGSSSREAEELPPGVDEPADGSRPRPTRRRPRAAPGGGRGVRGGVRSALRAALRPRPGRPVGVEHARRPRRPSSGARGARRARRDRGPTPARARASRAPTRALRRARPPASSPTAAIANACARCSRPATYRCAPSARTKPKRLVDAPHAEVDGHHICVVRSRPKNSWILSSMCVSACAIRAFRASSSRPSRTVASSTSRLASVPRDLRGDLRSLLQDLLEPGLVEAVALDVGQGDDVGAPRLAGEHPHLAEEARRVDASRPPWPASSRRRGAADLDLARAEDVEPVGHGALPGHGLARRERRIAAGARRATARSSRGERAEELHAFERARAARSRCRCAALALLLLRASRKSVCAGRASGMPARCSAVKMRVRIARARRVVVGQIRQPVADGVVREAVAAVLREVVADDAAASGSLATPSIGAALRGPRATTSITRDGAKRKSTLK